MDGNGSFEALQKLSKDLKVAAQTLGDAEARYMVDAYYSIQEYRKALANQIRMAEKEAITKGTPVEPNMLTEWMLAQVTVLEKNIKLAMDVFSDASPVGRWAKGVKGIGPVLAAGLLCHINIDQCPTVGHIWSFAGLNPEAVWGKGMKRPWNARLKVLCWKIGESFLKVSGYDDDIYGHMIAERKAYEVPRNLAGEYEVQARQIAATKRFNKGREAWKWYGGCLTAKAGKKIFEAEALERPGLMKKHAGEPGSGQPMLPPGHIHARAKRYAVKQFLSDLHAVWYRSHFGQEPPLPYPIGILGHTHRREVIGV